MVEKKYEMNIDQVSNLITNSTEIFGAGFAFISLIFAGFQAYLLFKTLEIAEKFESQHERRLQIDREFLFAENGYKALIEVSGIIEKMLDPNTVLDDPLYEKKKNEIQFQIPVYVQLTDKRVKYFFERRLAFEFGIKKFEKEFQSKFSELEFNVDFFESKELKEDLFRFRRTCQLIFNFINTGFFDLMNRDFKNESEYLDFFKSNIVNKFPDTLYDSTDLVKQYFDKLNKVRAFFLKKLKGK